MPGFTALPEDTTQDEVPEAAWRNWPGMGASETPMSNGRCPGLPLVWGNVADVAPCSWSCSSWLCDKEMHSYPFLPTKCCCILFLQPCRGTHSTYCPLLVGTSFSIASNGEHGLIYAFIAHFEKFVAVCC